MWGNCTELSRNWFDKNDSWDNHIQIGISNIPPSSRWLTMDEKNGFGKNIRITYSSGDQNKKNSRGINLVDQKKLIDNVIIDLCFGTRTNSAFASFDNECQGVCCWFEWKSRYRETTNDSMCCNLGLSSRIWALCVICIYIMRKGRLYSDVMH